MRKSFIAVIISIVAIIVAAIIAMVCVLFVWRADEVEEELSVEELLETENDKLTLNLSANDNYENYTLKDNKGRSMLVINGNNTAWYNLYIVSNAKTIVIKDLEIINSKGGTGIISSRSSASVTLENVTVRMQSNSGVALNLAAGSQLYVEGSVTLCGGDGLTNQDGGSAVIGESYLTIGGSGTLSLSGGDGGAGSNGTDGASGKSYSTSLTSVDGWFQTGSDGQDGGDGKDGSDGYAAGQGGDALVCDVLTVQDTVSIACYGGASNQSGNGGNGGDGGNGEGATKARPWALHSYKGGDGGDAGNGGNGGDESRPGYGIMCNSATISSAAKVFAVAGARGAAGSGGEAGTPGSGGESMSGAEEASAGSAGTAGSDGASLSEEDIKPYYILYLEGEILTG